MVKGEQPIFFKTVVFVIVLLLAEVGLLYYFYSPKTISGFSIADFKEAYANVYPTSKVFLYSQWIILFLIVLFVYLKNKGILKRNREKSSIDLEKITKGSKTDLDSLYNLLKEKKRVSIKVIAHLFEIEDDLAIDWARILEAGGLATVEYPGIGSPFVMLVEKEGEKNEPKKEEPIKQEVKESLEKKEEKDSPSEKVIEKKPSVKKFKRSTSKKSAK